jgi:hypothetical protein
MRRISGSTREWSFVARASRCSIEGDNRASWYSSPRRSEVRKRERIAMNVALKLNGPVRLHYNITGNVYHPVELVEYLSEKRAMVRWPTVAGLITVEVERRKLE